MNKLLVLSLFASIFLVGIVSAADYGYSNSYTVKESYDSYGYSYYQKSNSQTPWGEKTTYTRIKDYDAVPSFYIGDRNPYKNPVSTYWKDGPFHGYSSTQKYLDYHYDDAYNRARTGSQYYDYYYKPSKVYTSGSAYWDHGYQGYDCGNGYYCWKN
jgi:hypothetical protein